MKYKGPLYAKIAGKYVPVEHDSEYYDRLEDENNRLRSALQEAENCLVCLPIGNPSEICENTHQIVHDAMQEEQ